MAKEVNVGIQIKEIKEIAFHNKVSQEIVSTFNPEKLNVKMNFSVMGDDTDGTVALSILLAFQYSVDGKPKDIVNFTTQTVFRLLNYKESDQVNLADNKVTIADNIMQLLLTVAIGNTRGMFAYKNNSLPLDLVVPIINLAPMFPNMNKTEEPATKVKKTK